MKTTLLNLVRAIARYVSDVAASEAGELLSVRRKWHLLEAERYARLASGTEAAPHQTSVAGGHHRAVRHIRGTLHVARHA